MTPLSTLRVTRRVGPALAALVLVLPLSACNDDSSATSQPTPSATAAVSPTPPTAAPSPSWEDDYTPEELSAYDDALQRWRDYETATEPIWEAGKVTEAARNLFQEFFVSPVWQQYLNRLQTYESAKVTVTGLPTIFWSKASRIAISDGGGSVTVQQCVDYATQVLKQNGEIIDAIAEPVLRSAILDRSHGNAWLLLRIKEPSMEKFTSCSQDGP